MEKRTPICVHTVIFVYRFLMARRLPLPHVCGLIKQGN